jgi:hypothetical protein
VIPQFKIPFFKAVLLLFVFFLSVLPLHIEHKDKAEQRIL